MEVIPALNCLDFHEIESRFAILKKIRPEGGWVHLDVADGKFTYNITWADPKKWGEVGYGLKLEVHLMVEEPESQVPAWLEAGAKRVIVHLETAANLEHIAELCAAKGAEFVISSSPETFTERMRPLFGKFSKFQVLAVSPGLAGQKFLPMVLEKVRFIRRELPNAWIELDGGVNQETARQAKDAGVDAVVAATYIFNEKDPKTALAILEHI